MSDSDVLETTPKLKVFSLVADSYRTLFKNVVNVATMLWAVVAISVLYVYLQQYIVEARGLRWGEGEPTAVWGYVLGITLIDKLLMLLLVAVTAVSFHRLVLLGEAPGLLGFRIGKRERRFFGSAVVIELMIFGMASLPVIILAFLDAWIQATFESTGAMLGILGFFGISGLMIFGLVLLVRLWFALPAISIDEPGGLKVRLRAAWTMGRGNTVRMIAAIILAMLPWIVGLGVWAMYMVFELSQAQSLGHNPLESFFAGQGTVLTVMVNWLMAAVIFILYSHAYQALSENNESQLDQTVEP